MPSWRLRFFTTSRARKKNHPALVIGVRRHDNIAAGQSVRENETYSYDVRTVARKLYRHKRFAREKKNFLHVKRSDRFRFSYRKSAFDLLIYLFSSGHVSLEISLATSKRVGVCVIFKLSPRKVTNDCRLTDREKRKNRRKVVFVIIF